MAKAEFTITAAVATALRTNGYSVRDCAASVKAALGRMQKDGSRVTVGDVRSGKQWVKYSETERIDYVAKVGDPALTFAEWNDGVAKLTKKISFDVSLPPSLTEWLAAFKIAAKPESTPAPENATAPTA